VKAPTMDTSHDSLCLSGRGSMAWTRAGRVRAIRYMCLVLCLVGKSYSYVWGRALLTIFHGLVLGPTDR
jgi:hypothetical protein